MRLLALALVAVLALLLPAVPVPAPVAPVQTPMPMVVIAHIDTGANVYHQVFRDPSALAQQHPCTYLPGYPCSAVAIQLTFDDTKTVDELVALDAAEWAKVEDSNVLEQNLYWFPGTKVVGAIRFGAGGVNCPLLSPVPPANVLGRPGCVERRILDEHGHGTMTATRMGGNAGSLCPSCRVVVVEGLGGLSTRWAAGQGWIDVQTNSWLDLIPPPANQVLSRGHPISRFPDNTPDPGATTPAFAFAQDKMLVFAASGNGAAYLGGFAPTPTEILSTAAPGVILVGAHDNGQVAAWSGAPAHVASDGYGGLRASNVHTVEIIPHPMSCCTSAASPYAAGAGAAVVLAARQVLGDTGVGLRTMPNGDDAIAVGPNAPASGILAKGYLTLDEAKRLLKDTAEARPTADLPHDGLLHWLGSVPPTPNPFVETWGAGANPFCQGCWTLPLRWADVPPGAPAYASIGYGALGSVSVAAATAVLQGGAEPSRPEVDAFFAAEAEARAVFFTGA